MLYNKYFIIFIILYFIINIFEENMEVDATTTIISTIILLFEEYLKL